MKKPPIHFPALCKIPKFYLISWCEYLVEMYSFRWVSGDIPQKKNVLTVTKMFL